MFELVQAEVIQSKDSWIENTCRERKGEKKGNHYTKGKENNKPAESHTRNMLNPTMCVQTSVCVDARLRGQCIACPIMVRQRVCTFPKWIVFVFVGDHQCPGFARHDC